MLQVCRVSGALEVKAPAVTDTPGKASGDTSRESCRLVPKESLFLLPVEWFPLSGSPKGGRRGAVQGGASLSHLLSLASRAARRPRGRGHGQVGEQGPRPWRLPPGKRPLHVPQVQHQPQVGS